MSCVKQRSFVTLSLAGLCRTVTGADLEERSHKKGDRCNTWRHGQFLRLASFVVGLNTGIEYWWNDTDSERS